MTIYALNYREPKPDGIPIINTTSRSETWSKQLSPFFVGPIKVNGIICNNIENAWQYSKVYDEFVDDIGDPTQRYFEWRLTGYTKKWANRYPVEKGRHPLYFFGTAKNLIVLKHENRFISRFIHTQYSRQTHIRN